MAKVALKAAAGGSAADDIGVSFGRASRQSWPLGHQIASVLVVGSGPAEWLVIAPPGMQDEVLARLEPDTGTATGEFVTAVDLTHGRALVRLTGTQAAEVLRKETALDLSDPLFPDGAATRTAIAGLACDIVRDDQAGVPSYLVHCERSSGQYLFDSLLDAGAEFGIEIDGFTLAGSKEI